MIGNRTKVTEMSMMQLKTIIFDMDGTLLDSLDGLLHSTNAALAACGYPARTYEEVRAFVGNGVGKLIERALPGGLDNPDYEKCLAAFKGVIFAIIDRELGALQQHAVQVDHVLEQHLVDIEMSRFALSLLVHHANQVAEPVEFFLALLGCKVEPVYIIFLDDRQRASVSSDDVLNLPHI